MREITLTRGYVALVDDCDFDRVSAHKWQARVWFRADGSSRVSAQGMVRKSDGNRTMQQLHRLIMDAPAGMQVDHINSNPLDNRRVNLRLCTATENNHNMRPRTGGLSVYKGVHWHKGVRKWVAQIKCYDKRIYLGCFSSELDAAKAYDAAAVEMFGEFARMNTYQTKEV